MVLGLAMMVAGFGGSRAWADWTFWPLTGGEDAVISGDGHWVAFRDRSRWEWRVRVLSLDGRLGADLAGTESLYATLQRDLPSPEGPLAISVGAGFKPAPLIVMWAGRYVASTQGNIFFDLLALARRHTGDPDLEFRGGALAGTGNRAFVLVARPKAPHNSLLFYDDMQEKRAFLCPVEGLSAAADGVPELVDIDDKGDRAVILLRTAAGSGRIVLVDRTRRAMENGEWRMENSASQVLILNSQFSILNSDRWVARELPLGPWSQVHISGNGKRLALVDAEGHLASCEISEPAARQANGAASSLAGEWRAPARTPVARPGAEAPTWPGAFPPRALPWADLARPAAWQASGALPRALLWPDLARKRPVGRGPTPRPLARGAPPADLGAEVSAKAEVHSFPAQAVHDVSACAIDRSGRRIAFISGGPAGEWRAPARTAMGRPGAGAPTCPGGSPSGGIPYAIAFRGTVPVRIMDTSSAQSISLSNSGSEAVVCAAGQVFAASAVLPAPPMSLQPPAPTEEGPSPLQQLIERQAGAAPAEGPRVEDAPRRATVSSGIVAQDPDTGWALYRSEPLGLSFQLPPKWNAEEGPDGQGIVARSADGTLQLMLTVRDDGSADLAGALRELLGALGSISDARQRDGTLGRRPGVELLALIGGSGFQPDRVAFRAWALAARVGDRVLTAIATWPPDLSSDPPEEMKQAIASIRLHP